MTIPSSLRPFLGALALLAAPVAPAAAQFLTLEAGGGFATPAGDVAAPQGRGTSFHAGVGVVLLPAVTLRLDAGGTFMEEGRAPDNDAYVPGINLVHFVAGLESPLFRSAHAHHPVTVSGNLGAGVTRFEVEAFAVPQGRPQAGSTFVVQEAYPVVNGGLRLTVPATRRLDLLVSGQAYRTFVHDEDTAVLGLISDRVRGPGHTWDVPVTLGVRVRL